MHFYLAALRCAARAACVFVLCVLLLLRCICVCTWPKQLSFSFLFRTFHALGRKRAVFVANERRIRARAPAGVLLPCSVDFVPDPLIFLPVWQTVLKRTRKILISRGDPVVFVFRAARSDLDWANGNVGAARYLCREEGLLFVYQFFHAACCDLIWSDAALCCDALCSISSVIAGCLARLETLTKKRFRIILSALPVSYSILPPIVDCPPGNLLYSESTPGTNTI